MTSGTKTVDKRTGPLSIGSYATKTWNGADAPKVPRKQVSPPTYSVHTAYRKGKNGSLEPYLVKSRVRRSNPPRRMRGRGEHAYTMTARSMYNPPIEYRNFGSNKWEPSSFTSFFHTFALMGDPWTSNDTLACQGKLAEQIRGSDFNMGIVLAESGQTLDMIANNALRIASAIRSVRRGNVSEAANALTGRRVKPSVSPGFAGSSRKEVAEKVAANNWLQLQYGWLPLLNDIDEGAKFLASQLNYPVVQTYRASLYRDNTGYTHSPATVFPSKKGRSSMQIIARLQEKPSFARLSGLLAPETVAWELLPWSFVADWFIPIGDYLDTRNFFSGLTGTYITTRKQTAMVGGTGAYWNVVSPPSTRGGEAFWQKDIRLSRSVTSSLSVPMPEFKPLASVPSWKRAANAISLAAQAFSRPLRQAIRDF